MEDTNRYNALSLFRIKGGLYERTHIAILLTRETKSFGEIIRLIFSSKVGNLNKVVTRTSACYEALPSNPREIWSPGKTAAAATAPFSNRRAMAAVKVALFFFYSFPTF